MNRVLHEGLQKRLDLLDEEIDTLAREKEIAGDDDQPRDLEEAREVQQMAREDYSNGEFLNALLRIHRVEYCLYWGRDELARNKALLDELSKTIAGEG